MFFEYNDAELSSCSTTGHRHKHTVIITIITIVVRHSVVVTIINNIDFKLI